MKFLWAFSLFTLVLNACSPNPLAVGEVNIGFQELITLDDPELSIEFNKVIEDSRCPINVFCGWAGQVVIEIEIESGSIIIQRTLSPGTSEFATTIFNNLEITLLDVTPYPIYDYETISSEIPDEEYNVQLAFRVIN